MKLQLPVVITPTRAELGMRCHRRHFLGDILGRASYYSPSLEFGSVIHAGIAAHWLDKRKPGSANVNAALQAEWALRHVSPDSSMTLALATKMLEHYAAHAELAGPFTKQGNFKLVDVEQRFEVPLLDSILSFQMDRVVHDPDQNWLVVVDSKTAARLDSRWERQWETSLQMKLYRAGALEVFKTGGRVDIVVEGVLKSVPSDLRYYVCPEWSAGLLGEALHNAHVVAMLDREVIEQSCEDIVLRDALDKPVHSSIPNEAKAIALGVAMTPVNYMDCYSYGIECPFRRICVADVEHREGLLKSEYFTIQEESY